MTLLAAAAHIKGPHIDWASLMPIAVLGGGALFVLLLGLISAPFMRERVVPLTTILVLGGAIAADIVRFKHHASIVHGALQIDDLALIIDILCAASAIAATVLSWRSEGSRQAGEGEYHSLLLFSVMGMAILVSAQDLITLFIGIELLSIPLYVLCAAEHKREGSLESGLKYLIIGSVGSATLLYGLAMVYGATGATSFSGIAAALTQGKLGGGVLGDPLLFTGLGLVIAGFAFKASVAPFHQWTPDVYEGAPTPITAFMATATKAAALGVFLRFFDVAAINVQSHLGPADRRPRHVHDHRRQRRRARPVLAEADARLLGRGPGRLPAHRGRRRHQPRDHRRRPLPARLHPDEPRRVRRDRRASGARRTGDKIGASRASAPAPVSCVAADRRDAWRWPGCRAPSASSASSS